MGVTETANEAFPSSYFRNTALMSVILVKLAFNYMLYFNYFVEAESKK